MVTEEVRDFFTGSFLENAPIVPVDSISGEGIGEIVRLLDAKVAAMNFQEEFGPFRMAVDRVFSMKGFGTVITGTSLSGRIETGAELMFYPGGLAAKIRGIQVHGQDVDLVEAGHRTAINLQGIEKEQIQPGRYGGHARQPDRLHPARRRIPLSAFGPQRIEKPDPGPGPSGHPGDRRPHSPAGIGHRSSPARPARIQLILQEPVAVWPGDHYVIRSYSPITTIGGGTILSNAPKKRKRSPGTGQGRQPGLFCSAWRLPTVSKKS